MSTASSSVLVRLLYVFSWAALAGAIFFGGYNWIYFFFNQSDYGLSELEKAQVIRMKENCLWADLGWLTVVTVGFLLLKAIYFILKGEPQAGDQVFHEKFSTNFWIAFSIMALAAFCSFVMIKS